MDRPVSMIVDTQALIGGIVPEKDRADNVQRVFGKRQFVLEIDVGIGQIDRKQRVVVTQIGAEQQELVAIEQQLELPKKSRIATINSIGTAWAGSNIAVAVENREAIVMLQIASRAGRGPGRGDVKRNLRDLFDQCDSGVLIL